MSHRPLAFFPITPIKRCHYYFWIKICSYIYSASYHKKVFHIFSSVYLLNHQ